MSAVATDAVMQKLADLREKCPNLRLCQLVATLGLLAEDESGHSLWDVEDDELMVAIDRFDRDLARRDSAAT